MIRIMLDPGHFGSRFNASPAVPEYYESNMTWTLAHKLKKALEKRGFEVGLTRQAKDEDIELTRRGRMAVGYDMFLSLHSNAAASEAPDAPWIICLADDEKVGIDEQSYAAGAVLGEVISRVMGVSAPFFYTKKCDFDRDGNGQLDDEWYGVLFGAKSVGVPGVILEHSFHTNKKAALWLMSEENLEILAEAEAAALAKYYGIDNTEAEMTEAEKAVFEKLREKVDSIERKLSEVQIKYNWTTACPEWARGTVHKLHQKNLLEGDENGQLRLTEPMLRMLVILERAGVL